MPDLPERSVRLRLVALVVTCFALLGQRDSAANNLQASPEHEAPTESDEAWELGESMRQRFRAARLDAITEISVTASSGKGTPKDSFKKHREGAYNFVSISRPRGFVGREYRWKAPGLRHDPLYFEDVSLERYGQTHLLQPAISGLKFFATVPILPYKMGVDHPHDCQYTLGHGRPGNCNWPVREHLPLSLEGGLWEAGAVTGFAFLFP